jgi:hypothetical protein
VVSPGVVSSSGTTERPTDGLSSEYDLGVIISIGFMVLGAAEGVVAAKREE